MTAGDIAAGAEETRTICLRVNGTDYTVTVPVRKTLADTLREDLRLTGTHVACEHGVCGACTVLVNGRSARSCLMLAVQAVGAEIATVEGLASDPQLAPLREAFVSHQALQCGFCTPGMLAVATELLQQGTPLTAEEVRSHLAGNLCRCTGYLPIISAVLGAAKP